MQTISTAIIGFGKSARIFHMPILSYLPHFDVKKAYKRSAPTSEILDEFNGIEFTSDIDEVMSDKSIDLIIITTPNTSHYELCKKALQSDKHVVVEKPFTPSYDKCIELCNLAKKHDKVLGVYHNRRFDGDFLTVKQIIESGHLGRLVEYESHYDRFRNYPTKGAWREKPIEGSGIFYDLGSHIIEQALDIFGMPQTVFADIRTQRDDIETDDSFEVILGYPRLKVTLKSTMLCNAPKMRFLLNGTLGSYVKYGVDPQEQALKTAQQIDSNWGVEHSDNWGIRYLMQDGNVVEEKVPTMRGDYRKYYIDIYESIVSGKQLIVNGEHASNVVKIIEFAFKSNELDKVIYLS